MNGDFSNNSLFIPHKEESAIPYLNDFSTVTIANFKGEFYYPYPDSSVFIGLRYGYGFVGESLIHNKKINKNSEVYGQFKSKLDRYSTYKFSFDLTPYWGNTLIKDKIKIDLLDIDKNIVSTLKIKLDADIFFIMKKIEAIFISKGGEMYFHLYFDSSKDYRHIHTNYSMDSINCRKRNFELTSNKFTDNERLLFAKEDSFRRNSPFVYYLTSNYSCVELSQADSNCLDTIFSYHRIIEATKFDSLFNNHDFRYLSSNCSLFLGFDLYAVNAITNDEKIKIKEQIENQLYAILPSNFPSRNLMIHLNTYTKSRRSNISSNYKIVVIENKCHEEYTTF